MQCEAKLIGKHGVVYFQYDVICNLSDNIVYNVVPSLSRKYCIVYAVLSEAYRKALLKLDIIDSCLYR